MKKKYWITVGVQLLLTLNMGQAVFAQRKPVQVSIRTEQTYQTIEGFGAGIIDFTEPPAFFNDPKLYDLAVNDLGMSILRMSFPQELEAVNDDNDPNHFNWPAYHMPYLERRMRIALEFKKRGVEKFIASTWSPPEFTKTHHATTQGGHLRMDMYEEYAENMAAFVMAAKQNWGIDIGALSIQNELMFIEPYKSCIYLPEQAREAVRALMHKFQREGIRTQIQLPEDMMFLDRMLGYIEPTMADPETRNFHGSFATHRQQEFETVRKWYEATKQYNRQTWMTETSGHHQNWQGAMKMASDMYDYLVGGNMSAWMYWQIAEPNSEYALMDGPNTSPKYFAAKHFYRYVRPGALRVEGQSTDSDVLVSAFRHNAQGTITVILINRSDTGANVKLTLDGKNLPRQFTWYRSTEQEQCERKGTLKSNALALALPPQSIITLTGENEVLRTGTIQPWPQAWETPAGAEKQKWGNFNKIPEGPGAALSNIIQWQEPEAFRKELANGANIQATLANGWTPLHTAILNGKLDAVQLLLAKGAEVNQPAKDGWTPLHMAAGTFVGGGHQEEGRASVTKYDVFKAVLAAKPDVNARTEEGHTPLHAAVMNAHTAWRQNEDANFHRISDLVKAGADLEATDEAGRTPLHWAAWQAYGRVTDMVRASDGVVKVLITAGANLNTLDKRGRTPLHYASEMGYGPIVMALVKAGANTRVKDKDGNTPEALAQGRSLNQIVEILQNKETALSTPVPSHKELHVAPPGKYGAELLQAAWKGEVAKVKELLEKEADVFYRDSDGFRAVDRARDNGHKEIVKLLQRAEARSAENQK